MKVLLLSISDRIGGAAIGAYRLHRALRKARIDSQMLVLYKATADPTVHRLAAQLGFVARARRRLAEKRHAQRLRGNPRAPHSDHWSLNLFDYPIAEVINRFAADIVHLHWVGDNFLPLSQLPLVNAPLVCTLRDNWFFTGGCHYSGDCARFRASCGDCPQLLAGGADDLSAKVFRHKQRAFAAANMAVVALGDWIASRARESALLGAARIEVIGNAIDGDIFKPLDRAQARHALNLPQDKRLLLFGALGGTSDKRKGFAHLQAALARLDDEAGIELVVFGARQPEALEPSLPLHQVGWLRDELSLSLLYSACDVFALPSLQDTSPKTVMEALACGTPCVAFAGSGAADMIRPPGNGYLARLADSDDLRAGILWALSKDWDRAALHKEIIAHYSETSIARQHIQLYQSLL
ncbi:MAG: glycosyltransferase [Chloroflexi bacterium]|nr:glycosyltransferase [Chloroflexota bacterium]MDE2650120.1 glycosyltransferase [Chloroflexota bacterium]MXX81901.1 glycosyltransferase [Chloroflexota bacterium]MYC55767.1 glycosyltransferase [Chloroflexota bacterium]MYH64807.1 glycosyltransferase [Chloroflexota bacterium]